MESVEPILDILETEEPDLFFLSEIEEDFLDKNQHTLIKIGFEHFLNPGCERVKIIKRKTLALDLHKQTRYYTTVYIKEINLFILSVHLPSQMFNHERTLREFLKKFRDEIDNKVGSSLRKRVLIIGDFNINPYEGPMIDKDGFLATNSYNARIRIDERNTYFNPTWQLYNRGYFPGTKYFPRPSGFSFDITEFHFLDQVVVSQKFQKEAKATEISIIESTMKFSFFNKAKNKIEQSDHLPLMYKFKF
ncbi:MAG: endonuclease/exonuclease/phosphatase family protein [Bacteroidetes bacterium]|nr:endonuclease/exonuclease/phosphatase family protein [Bacteroidota bacterium]